MKRQLNFQVNFAKKKHLFNFKTFSIIFIFVLKLPGLLAIAFAVEILNGHTNQPTKKVFCDDVDIAVAKLIQIFKQKEIDGNRFIKQSTDVVDLTQGKQKTIRQRFRFILMSVAINIFVSFSCILNRVK